MKKNAFFIFGIIGLFVGMFLIIFSRVEAASVPRWDTETHSLLNLLMWGGIAMIVNGLINVALKVYQMKYTGEHIKDVNELTHKGGAKKCPDCGLTVSGDVKKCPRCGAFIRQ